MVRSAAQSVRTPVSHFNSEVFGKPPCYEEAVQMEDPPPPYSEESYAPPLQLLCPLPAPCNFSAPCPAPCTNPAPCSLSTTCPALAPCPLSAPCPNPTPFPAPVQTPPLLHPCSNPAPYSTPCSNPAPYSTPCSTPALSRSLLKPRPFPRSLRPKLPYILRHQASGCVPRAWILLVDPPAILTALGLSGHLLSNMDLNHNHLTPPASVRSMQVTGAVATMPRGPSDAPRAQSAARIQLPTAAEQQEVSPRGSQSQRPGAELQTVHSAASAREEYCSVGTVHRNRRSLTGTDAFSGS
ncbi:hypothetical protein WMY93_012757 [Mugilogobius chulae]|uniref:Uncharacterized protein n=1 Tax=Mugilogobius chulae TaxID=88201 RepID=A0AAW0NY23_9GOBI